MLCTVWKTVLALFLFFCNHQCVQNCARLSCHSLWLSLPHSISIAASILPPRVLAAKKTIAQFASQIITKVKSKRNRPKEELTVWKVILSQTNSDFQISLFWKHKQRQEKGQMRQWDRNFFFSLWRLTNVNLWLQIMTKSRPHSILLSTLIIATTLELLLMLEQSLLPG